MSDFITASVSLPAEENDLFSQEKTKKKKIINVTEPLPFASVYWRKEFLPLLYVSLTK